MYNFAVMKIYTKTGDDGSTGLLSGQRVQKDDPRVECYGTVDELGAAPDHIIASLAEVPALIRQPGP